MTLAHLVSHLILLVLRHFIKRKWRISDSCGKYMVPAWQFSMHSGNLDWLMFYLHVIIIIIMGSIMIFSCLFIMYLLSLSHWLTPSVQYWVTGPVVVCFMQRVVCVLVTQLRIILKEFALGWKSYRKNSYFLWKLALEPSSELLQTWDSAPVPSDFRPCNSVCWE